MTALRRWVLAGLLAVAGVAHAQPSLIGQRAARLMPDGQFTGFFVDLDAYAAADPKWRAAQQRLELEQRNDSELQMAARDSMEWQFICGAADNPSVDISAALASAPPETRERVEKGLREVQQRAAAWKADPRSTSIDNPVNQCFQQLTDLQLAIGREARSMEDRVLGPLAPALIADIDAFGRATGRGNVQIFRGKTLTPELVAGPRNVTRAFQAWQASNHK